MNHPAFAIRSSTLAVAALRAVPGASTQAQTIERMRMTDDALTCQQIHHETVPMDAVVARALQPGAVAATMFLSKGCKLGGMQR